MATEFIMPKLGLTMEEGTITEWLVDDGDTVTAGAAVMRIETDKTETDVEAAGTGRLHRLGQVGETFACGEVIGWFLADGEAPRIRRPAAAAAVGRPAAAPAPSRSRLRPATGAATGAAGAAAGGRIMASPLAKRLAAERNIDLRAITRHRPGRAHRVRGPRGCRGDGSAPSRVPAPPHRSPPLVRCPRSAPVRVLPPPRPRATSPTSSASTCRRRPRSVEQRVTRESVALHVRQLLAAAAPTPPPPPARPRRQRHCPPATQEPTSTVRLSGMRGTIARRMHDSLTQMAQLTLFMDADLDAVVADRERRKADGAAPSYTDYVIAAAARALGDHPLVNSQITADGVALLPTCTSAWPSRSTTG